METRRRITLYDQMSAIDGGHSSFAGLNLDAAAMASHKRAVSAATTGSRTLLDIIKEEAPNKKDRKSWRSFKNKLRLKRAGSAWFSSSHIAIPNRSNSDSNLTAATSTSRPHSFRRDGAMTFRDCFSDDDDSDPAREGTRRLSTVISEDRALSEREAEAAAAAAVAAAEHDDEEPVRMSLMDLLEETDRQMGFDGSMYRERDEEVCESVKETANREDEGEEEEEEEDEEEEEIVEENKEGGGRKSSSIEQKCCVCMVRRKGAAFIPCGHTFCRQCSRELWVNRGHCPLCNNFIVEILDLF